MRSRVVIRRALSGTWDYWDAFEYRGLRRRFLGSGNLRGVLDLVGRQVPGGTPTLR